ncbi:MAG: hypothetical protein JJU18_00585, partial [Oceanicaulis sp.]|nr:hypothetical protein [Oceanicaulis sp.]
PRRPPRAPHPQDAAARTAALGMAVLALLMVAVALSGAARARRIGRPGLLMRIDAHMTRLILGRNS